jgi:hypothetical protein
MFYMSFLGFRCRQFCWWWSIQNLNSCIFWNKTFFDTLLVEIYDAIAIKNFTSYSFVLIDASSLTSKYDFDV